MADDKARIEASLAGVEGINAGQKKIADGWKPVEEAQANVSKGAKALDGAWKGLKTGIKSLASDALRATGILQGISLAKGVDEARAMQAATTRFAQKTGESANTLSTRLDGLEKRTLTSSPAMLSFSQALQAVTYDSSFATGSLGELGDIALSMGESLSDQLGFAETMRTGLGVTEKLTGEFDRLRGMAEELGISGGIQSFRDALVSANGELQNIAINGDRARIEVEAMAAALTKGFKPDQQKRVLNATLALLRNRATDIERVTGKQVLNARGELMNPAEALKAFQGYLSKRSQVKGWSERTKLQAYRSGFGIDAAAGILNFDPAEFAKALEAGLNAKSVTGDKADDLRNTPAGQNLARQLDRDQQLRHAGEVLLDASNKFYEVVGVWGALGTQLAAQLGGGVIGPLLEGLGLGAATKGAAGLASKVAMGGVGAALLPITAMAAVGYYGYRDITGQNSDARRVGELNKQNAADANAVGMATPQYLRFKRQLEGTEAGKNLYSPMEPGQPIVIDQSEILAAVQNLPKELAGVLQQAPLKVRVNKHPNEAHQ